MRKQGKGLRTSSSGRTRHFRVVGIVAAVSVLAMAAAAISMQASQGRNSNLQSNGRNSSHANYEAIRFAGQDIQDGAQTGQIRPLTQEEAQKLAEGIKGLVNQSTDGLKSVRHADGSVSINLQGHFQNIALAKKTDGGTLAQSCVDNPESAAVFFGIDPQLIEGQTKGGPTRADQPEVVSHPKN